MFTYPENVIFNKQYISKGNILTVVPQLYLIFIKGVNIAIFVSVIGFQAAL